MYKVVEMFTSINGEGQRAGRLSMFIRFAGCNLRCSYCDTMWANQENTNYTLMTKEEIYEEILKANVKNITVTGGEPLMQESIYDFLDFVSKDENIFVEIETNGSIEIDKFKTIKNTPSFTMDYKLETSLMEDEMCLSNFEKLDKKDTLKFVCGGMKDLKKAHELIKKYDLDLRTNVYLSPVFGKIEPKDMVEYIKENELNDVTLQIQLHKVIWDPEEKGV